MKKKLNYKEQIKSPKWQKRRLEILQRDDFTCQICGATEKQLHVHHLAYIPGRDIWDYDDYRLITLCEDCHKIEHVPYNEEEGLYALLHNVRMEGYTITEIKYLLEELITSDILLQFISFMNKKTDNNYRKRETEILNRLMKRRDEISKYIPYKV